MLSNSFNRSSLLNINLSFGYNFPKIKLLIKYEIKMNANNTMIRLKELEIVTT